MVAAIAPAQAVAPLVAAVEVHAVVQAVAHPVAATAGEASNPDAEA